MLKQEEDGDFLKMRLHPPSSLYSILRAASLLRFVGHTFCEWQTRSATWGIHSVNSC